MKVLSSAFVARATRRKTFLEVDVHPHVASERAAHFHTEDGGATEIEYLSLLASLIRITKPQLVLETGAFTGAGTIAIASALRANGFGHCISVDLDPRVAERANRRLRARRLHGFAHVEGVDSMTFLQSTDKKFDFAFLDTDLRTRADELTVLLDRNLLIGDAVVTIHDTSRVREFPAGQRDPEGAEFWRRFEQIRPRISEVFEFKLSRGMLLIRV